jgi:hypothetical protein
MGTITTLGQRGTGGFGVSYAAASQFGCRFEESGSETLFHTKVMPRMSNSSQFNSLLFAFLISIIKYSEEPESRQQWHVAHGELRIDLEACFSVNRPQMPRGVVGLVCKRRLCTSFRGKVGCPDWWKIAPSALMTGPAWFGSSRHWRSCSVITLRLKRKLLYYVLVCLARHDTQGSSCGTARDNHNGSPDSTALLGLHCRLTNTKRQILLQRPRYTEMARPMRP